MEAPLSEEFLPEPENGDGTENTEDEVGDVAFAKQLYFQEVADGGADIAAYDANDEIDDASFALAAHDAVGKIADKDTCEYRPCREICEMF